MTRSRVGKERMTHPLISDKPYQRHEPISPLIFRRWNHVQNRHRAISFKLADVTCEVADRYNPLTKNRFNVSRYLKSFRIKNC